MSYNELRCLANGVIVAAGADRFRGDLYYSYNDCLILSGVPSGGVVAVQEKTDIEVSSVCALPATGGYRTILLGKVLMANPRITSLVSSARGSKSNAPGRSTCEVSVKAGDYVTNSAGRVGYVTYLDSIEAIVDYGLSVGTQTYDPAALSKVVVQPLGSLLPYCGLTVEFVGASTLSPIQGISNIRRYVVVSASDKDLGVIADNGNIITVTASVLMHLGAMCVDKGTFMVRSVDND